MDRGKSLEVLELSLEHSELVPLRLLLCAHLRRRAQPNVRSQQDMNRGAHVYVQESREVMVSVDLALKDPTHARQLVLQRVELGRVRALRARRVRAVLYHLPRHA